MNILQNEPPKMGKEWDLQGGNRSRAGESNALPGF
jgi:hypothetical protein